MSSFGRWLRVKRNFYLFSTLAFGLPCWACEIWATQEYISGVAWIVFFGVVGLGAGWLWGFFMWRFFAWKYPSTRTNEHDRSAT